MDAKLRVMYYNATSCVSIKAVRKLDEDKFKKRIFCVGGLHCGKTKQDLLDIGPDARRMLPTDRKSPDAVKPWCHKLDQG